MENPMTDSESEGTSKVVVYPPAASSSPTSGATKGKGGDEVKENPTSCTQNDDDVGKQQEEPIKEEGVQSTKVEERRPAWSGKEPTVRIHRQSVQEMVNRKHPMVLAWENLTVHVGGGAAGSASCRSGCCTPMARFGQEYLGTTIQQIEPFYALHQVNGCIRTGEMVLVLSPNQLHASMLLRTLSGRLTTGNDDTDMSGSITVNGLPISKHHYQGWRFSMPYVAASDATHAAVLTVRETFEFAARCCNYETNKNDNDDALTSTSTSSSLEIKIQDRVDALLRMLDLEHVADTVVGDENLRGISGGQKRRVTVGEMLLNPKASFLALENITDGLSSQDSSNLIRRLSQVCTAYRIGAIISLLQPSDDIVEQYFDKIMVLSEDGEVNYFGPVDRIQLTRIFDTNTNSGDENEMQNHGSICDLVLGNHSKDSVVTNNPEEDLPVRRNAIKALYEKSDAYASLMDELQAIRAKATSSYELHDQEQEIRKLLPTTKYATTWDVQFKIIASRRLKLIARNAVTYTRIVIAILFGCVVGSLFSILNDDIIGSLGRTGYMFLNCFLVLMLSAAITIPQTFRERVTLFKHRSAEFYSGRVAYITQMLLDMPLSILEAVLLSVVTYWWVGMNSGIPNFFYFMGTLIGLEFVGQSLGRLLCATSRKQILANMLSSGSILIFGTVAGFMPSFDGIPAIFRWLSWLTPASYAFEGLMINQFIGHNLTGFVVATQKGNVDLLSIPGEAWLSATGLPRQDWASPTGIKLFDLFMLFFLSIVFDILGCYFVEHTREWYFNQSRPMQRIAVSTTFDAGVKGINDPGSRPNNSIDDNQSEIWPNSLSVESVSYYVPIKGKRMPMRCTWSSIINPVLAACFGKQKGIGDANGDANGGANNANELQLLTSVNARFSRGRMTALMGTSGAGKTTLLDVIAGYKTGGRITGSILIDGCPKQTSVWKRISAYAEQMDILNPYLSSLETLNFTAACRLPKSVNREAVINNIVQLMELEEYLDMVIGREVDGEGLPKHARKRLTIAVQLVTLPKILFADEPTTGLGTTAASIVMQALRRCTNNLQLITVVTIHQPSKLIWDAFDDLLLLVKGGNTAYMGTMGENSQHVIEYFSKVSGAVPPPHSNPADYVLSVVGELPVSDVIDTFSNSKVRKDTLRCIDTDKITESSTSISSDAMKKVRVESKRSKNFFRDLLLLTKRHAMTQWRNPSYSMIRLFTSFVISLYMSILFIGKKSSIEGAVYSIGAIFFLVFVLVIPMQASVVHLIEDRAVLYREVSSGLYSRPAYGLGQLAADIPFHILNALVMFVMFYFIVGFQREGPQMGYFLLMTFVSNWVITSLGQLFALGMPNEESATGLAGLSVILSVVLMGFLITVNAMPQGWVWAYWANLFHYIVQGLVTNELVGRYYQVFLPDDLLPANASQAVLFPTGTTSLNSSIPTASAGFLNLVTLAGPGTNYDWNSSGVVSVGDLVGCMSENGCLEEPLAANFISCCIFNVFKRPPCKSEFDRALDAVNLTGVAECFEPYLSKNIERTDTTGSPLDALVEEDFANSNPDADLQLVLCLLRILLPPGFLDSVIRSATSVIDLVYDVVPIIVNIAENGLSLPGELILWFLGWAEWEPSVGLVAPFKWWYCMFAAAMFLLGLEVLKIFALQFIVWTKR